MIANSYIRIGVPIATDDNADLPQGACDAIYVGVSGDIALTGFAGGASLVYKSVLAGVWFPVGARRVLSTGTTATNLVAGYY